MTDAIKAAEETLTAILHDSAAYLKAHLQQQPDGSSVILLDPDEQDVVVKKWVRLIVAIGRVLQAEDAASEPGETRQ